MFRSKARIHKCPIFPRVWLFLEIFARAPRHLALSTPVSHSVFSLSLNNCEKLIKQSGVSHWRIAEFLSSLTVLPYSVRGPTAERSLLCTCWTIPLTSIHTLNIGWSYFCVSESDQGLKFPNACKIKVVFEFLFLSLIHGVWNLLKSVLFSVPLNHLKCT